MIEITVQLPQSPASLRARINAIARPRRSALQSPRNVLRHHDEDPKKPYWGHWDESRFSLWPQQRRRWTNLHLWSPQFDGEVRPTAAGTDLRIRASLGTYATMSYLVVLGLLLFMAISLMLRAPLTACIALGFAVILACVLYAQLRCGLAGLVARLDRGEHDSR